MKKLTVGGNFLHTHPQTEKALILHPGHVIVDREDFYRVVEFFSDNPLAASKLFGKNLPESGLDVIAKERNRQLNVEGWTPEHDAQHTGQELAMAAACYALPESHREMGYSYLGEVPYIFPFDPSWWKPTPDDRIKELAKAGALIAAEIDRIQNL